MEAVIRALTKLIEADEELETERTCLVDTSEAPQCIQQLVTAMRTHSWDVQLGEYRVDDNGSGKVFTLGMIFELLEDLDTELDEALAQAGADGGALEPEATLLLGPDGGGMSHLGVSWSGGKLSFCVVEFEEDPNEDGLVKHFNTPGALFTYLENYLTGVNDDDEHVAALKAAAEAAGDSMEPAKPVRSKAP